ncbi:hypothetical protein V8E54_007104 [Elaphomyces granulatus]
MAMTSLPIGPNSLSHKTIDDLKIDSSERRLDELVVEYKKKPVPNMEEHVKIIQHIREELDSDQLFLRWFHKLHEDLSGFNKPDNREARAHDGDALWLNEPTTLGFALGRFHGFQLALRINERALQPLETDPSTYVRLGVATINPSAVLGLQYIDITAHSTEARATKKMLIATLGNIFFTKDMSLPASKRKWSDTEYVLALEVDDNGRAASFVVVYNLTYWDEIDYKGRSIPVEAKSEGPKLCGEWLKFTVARVHGQVSDLLKPDWGAHEEVDVKLQVLSNATTEVVESGLKRTTWAKGALPIGLYPLAKP